MKTLVITLLMCTASVASGLAQQAPLARPAQQAQPQAQTSAAEIQVPPLKLDASVVSVDVLVTRKDGRVIGDLTRANFRVYDNGVPQSLASFAPATDPMRVVILMEFGADSYGYFAARAASWSASFLDHLSPQDWVALVTFDMRSKVQVDFTRSPAKVREALLSIGPPTFREVNLFDALADTVEMLKGVAGKKSILLIATGANTFSSATLDEVRKALQGTDATVFVVGMAEIEALRSEPSPAYSQARNILSSFARQTGGMALFPRFEGELREIFANVVAFERNLYNVTFKIPPASRDGRFHKLKVDVVGPDGKPLKIADAKGRMRPVEVYAREGYTAPRQ